MLAALTLIIADLVLLTEHANGAMQPTLLNLHATHSEEAIALLKIKILLVVLNANH